jgi:hypothetical protein
VSCDIGCHSQPDIGGTSPATNQSFFSAHNRGATNRVPFFEKIDGPTREVRFTFNPDGSRDGGVHQKSAQERRQLGIRGVTNNGPNDGTISHFGWKAQNKRPPRAESAGCLELPPSALETKR